ncbi:MAG: hypothetical protein Aurels2KO_14600 [Aureliella sp.]
MSSRQGDRSSAASRYIERALSLNPVWESAAICDLRSRALKRPRLDRIQQDSASKAAAAAARSAANQTIENVQKQFWKLPVDELNDQLSSVRIDLLPELEPVVSRLQSMARHRSAFPPLSQESWMPTELFQALKKSAVLPPTEAGFVRERFLRKIENKNQLRQIQQAAVKLESAYPALYELQRDWFETLRKQKRITKKVDLESGSGGFEFSLPEFGWPAWLVVFIILRVIMALIRSGGP